MGGRPKRGYHSNEKYKQYSLQLLFAEGKRIVRRLQNQKSLFADLLQTDNVEMMNREVEKLDGIQEHLLETYTQIRELVQETETLGDKEEQSFQSLVVAVDKEESEVFAIKKEVSVWMVAHSGDVETSSVGSGGSRRSIRQSRSRAAVSVRSGRTGSLRSVRSESTESLRSVKSDGSRTSHVSQKARVAGLKAELEVLTREGEKEINVQVQNMISAAEAYKKEQSALLKADMVHLQQKIVLQDEDVEYRRCPDAAEDGGYKECTIGAAADIDGFDTWLESDLTKIPPGRNIHSGAVAEDDGFAFESDLTKVPDGDQYGHDISSPLDVAAEKERMLSGSSFGDVIGGMRAYTESLREKNELQQGDAFDLIQGGRQEELRKKRKTAQRRLSWNPDPALDQDVTERPRKKEEAEQVRKKGRNGAMNLMPNRRLKMKPPLHVTSRKKNVIISSPVKHKKRGEYHPTKETSSSDQVVELSHSLLKILAAQSAPKVEIDDYDGDPLEYVYFRENVRDRIERVIVDQRGRLNRLIQCTVGEAKELIRHCVHNNPNSCYDDAIALLAREYGDPLRIGCAYLEKLKNWPVMKNGDGVGFRSLYRFLNQCLAYQKNGLLSGLDSPLMIRSVQLKLPVNMQDKWSHIVCKVRRRDGRETAFKDFVAFVESESAVLNDPIYSRSGGDKLKVNRINTKPGGSTGMPPAPPADTKQEKKTEKPAEVTDLPQESAPAVCPCCNNQHDLDDCEEFKKKKTVKERKQFLYEVQRCWACYGSGHKAQECVKKRVCDVCSQGHPTALHVFKTNAIWEQGEGNGAGMCVVPVRLSHPSHPGEKLLVYAMLDECSQGCFIEEDILMHFSQVPMVPKDIATGTIHGDASEKALSSDGFTVECSESHEMLHSPSVMVQLPTVYSRNSIPMDADDIPSKKYLGKWDYLDRVSRTFPETTNIPVGLLIGRNCPKAMEPVEVIPSEGEGPYAYRTRLGWCVGMGDDTADESNKITVNSISLEHGRLPVKDVISGGPSAICFSVNSGIKECGIEEQALKEVFNGDTTTEYNSEEVSLSIEDRQFLKIMEDNIRLVDGHYEVPLPFRHEKPVMPDNRQYAVKRTESIKRRMLSEEFFCSEYTEFMTKLIASGHARKAAPVDDGESCWYLPHFAVFHPTKGKMRVVLDCSAKYRGVSLNSELLQGPDMMNQMAGVFIRFREELFAIIGDIKAMYLQVAVPEHQRRYIRFLWWPDGNLDRPLEEYEMCVHVFGAVSSMGCVNYALRRAAEDSRSQCDGKAAETMRRDFYVDDLATSEDKEAKAASLIKDMITICGKGGFDLTKIMCNSTDVMETIPVEKRSEVLKNFFLSKCPLVERPLGVLWMVENDSLGFVITFKTGALTRIGILKTINGVYDLLGIASPFVLPGRKVLQEITAEKVSWEEDVGSQHVKTWCLWKEEIVLLRQLEFPRCYKPKDFGEVVDISLHTFGDGCHIGYGAACYVRQVDQSGNIAVSLAMGKARVSPLKMVTIPRLELTAATVAVKIGAMVSGQLRQKATRMFYYTDSKVALGYILNDVKRFRVYVGNRQNLVRSHSKKEDWAYVDTKENPADDASRGLSMKQEEKVKRWLYGSEHLHREEKDWNLPEVNADIDPDDPEVVKTVNASVLKADNSLDTLEKRVSSYISVKRSVAVVVKFIKKLKGSVQRRKSANKVRKARSKEAVTKLTEKELRRMETDIVGNITVEELKEAEVILIKNAQSKFFKQEIAELKRAESGNGGKLRRKALRKIFKLDPFIDEQGVLRARGRLQNSLEENTVKFPVILPRKALLSQRIAEYYHRAIHHCGRSSTVSEIRQNGFWIVGISGIVRSLIFHCVGCRVQRGALGSQKMADLPADRMSAEATEAPFTYCGVDMFGPFKVKEGRKEHKRYCALFTCFSSRAVHVEVTARMDTDSFIQALVRFRARRGPVRSIKSDNGGNFVGAENELRKAWEEMDHSKISDHLGKENCDWIKWERNVPEASHMGGIWERQIRTVRGVLNSILMSRTKLLDDESFRTLLTEVEAIVNSRPLTLEDVNNPESMPISPMNILTMKTKVVSAPPGVFQKADMYCRKRWRVVQHLANEFWSRWRKEYLLALQARSKWTEKKRNFEVGDVVLLKDGDTGRNKWPLGVVVSAAPGEDGLVRTVEVRVATRSIFKRPIHKLVLLLKSPDGDHSNVSNDASSTGEC